VAATSHAHKEFGPAQYLAVWVGLLVLTALTVAVWKMHFSLGTRVTLALTIATFKAGLVALFFMHLWEHGGVTRLVMATSLLFLVLLIGLVLADNATRFQYANPPYSEPWLQVPYQQMAPPMQDQPPPLEAAPPQRRP